MIRALSVLFLTLALIVPALVARADDLSARIAAAKRLPGHAARHRRICAARLQHRRAAYRNPNAGALIWTASTIKLAIVVDLLARTYAGQLRLNDQDRQLISAMLHPSDNDAADTLWDRYGGPDHQAFNRNFPATACPVWSPARVQRDLPRTGVSQKATADDLDGLINYTLTRLNPTDIATIVTAMQNVDADQQWGSGVPARRWRRGTRTAGRRNRVAGDQLGRLRRPEPALHPGDHERPGDQGGATTACRPSRIWPRCCSGPPESDSAEGAAICIRWPRSGTTVHARGCRGL